MKLLAVCLFLGICFVVTANAATDKIICYYGSWAHYRKGDATATVKDLNPNLCTHFIYTFVGINGKGDVTILDSWLDIDLKALQHVVEMKNINPKFKVLVAIGGWNQGSATFSNVVGNSALRKTFVDNIVAFVTKYSFDGFDLDWEYPNQRGGAAADKKNFILLIKELRQKFNEKKLLLTAAVGASKHHRDLSYDVPQMSKYLDFINVMSYDLHYFADGFTGFNAPLYASPSDKTPELNVNDIIEGWIKDGAAPEKIILGLGFYGKSYTLADASNHGVGAPTNGAGQAGQYTQEGGVLSYLEICKHIKFDQWTTAWDAKQEVPYAYKGNQWVGYDDVKSLNKKVDLAKKKNLGGVMMWSIEQDDLHNKCGDGHFPLLTALNNRIGRDVKPGFVSPTIPLTTTSSPSIAPSSDVNTGSTNAGGCKNGVAPDLKDCNYFYQCGSDGTKYHLKCPATLEFDKVNLVCNFKEAANCKVE